MRVTATTLERYKYVVKIFVAHLGEKAKKPITSVTPRDVEGFMNSRLKIGLAPKTAILDPKMVNIAFRRAENYNIIPKNPAIAVCPPKEVCSEREVFTQEEIQLLVKAAPTVERQTLILLGYFIGARF